MTPNPNRNVYKSVVWIWLTLSVGSVLLATVTWLQLSRQLGLARHAFNLQSSTHRILKMLLDCETGERGYVITGNEAFLEPMVTGQTNLASELDAFVSLTRDDPALLQQVVDLKAAVAVILDRFNGVVEARKSQGLAAAEAIISTNETKKLMDELRARLAQIRETPRESVLDGDATARAQLLRAGLTSLVAGVLGIGAGVISLWLSRLTLQQKERERDLVEAKLHAERSSQEKTKFLANMSHEIRTPMNAILGFSELLHAELNDPKHRQYAKSVRSSAGSLLQLINDILDMSKIEAGVMELRPEPTDPREICEFIHTVFAEPTVRKKLKLECVVSENMPRALLLDRIRLRQILVNLVGNAVKFTDQGHIVLRLICEKGKSSSHVTLVIDVQDTGVGIPSDRLEAIFKPFIQAGAHREKEKQGTGLGLAIVKRLTEAMGGTISAASQVGQGAAFHLRFPDTPISVRLATTDQGLAIDGDRDFSEFEPAVILVADDNAENCQLIAGMFAGSPHRLEFARDGIEAVAKARALRPDLILLDVRMPGMDGREALAQIRRSPALEVVPVIAVTASSMLEEEATMRETFSGHLRKPFSRQDLFKEILQFLPRRAKTGSLPASEAALMPSASPKPSGPVAAPLTAELRRLLELEWPAIRDGLAINETKAFAVKLTEAAERWPCPRLADYARGIARRADLYEVVDLELQLNEFPALVTELSRAKN